jgi:putative redox protein
MVKTTGEYLGDLRCSAVHGPSGDEIKTDAPKDNQGKGEAFSPTDLVGTALGTCVMTIIGIAAEKLGLDIAGSRFTVEKKMVADPLRRIERLTTTIVLPASLSDRDRTALERAGSHCPVHRSLSERLEAPLRFVYEDFSTGR